MKPKYFILALLLIFLMPLCFADSSGGILQAKQGDCIQLPQECPNCTFVKLTTITLPDLQQFNIQTNMAQNGTSYSYSFCNTTQVGSYSYCTLGDNDAIYTTLCNDFRVTPSGLSSSSGEAVIYIFLIIVVLIFFGLCLAGAIGIDGKNTYDMGGKIMKINYGKYLKNGLFWLSIILLWLLFYLGWEVSNKVLMFDFVGSIFSMLFYILSVLIAPCFIAFVVLSIIQWTADLKLWELAERNLPARNTGRGR